MEEQRNRLVWLEGEKKTPSGKRYADVLVACTLGIHLDAGPEVFFAGSSTSDDDLLAPLDSLLHGRRRGLLVTPPLGSHGAAQPRSEQQALCFLWAQWHERIQRSRVAAAACASCGRAWLKEVT
jgi:hypothetical protein